MTKIYFLNTIKDVQAFAKAFPDSRWISGRPLDLTRDFKAPKPPVALYQFTDNLIAWDYIRNAREDLANAPYAYVLTTIPKCLTLGEIFYAFLKHHNVVEQYLFNFNYGICNSPADNVIEWAFYWPNTDEGEDFWNTLNNKWVSLLDDLKIEDDLVITDIYATIENLHKLSLMEKLHD